MLRLAIIIASLFLLQCTKGEKEAPKGLSREVVQSLPDEEIILEYNGGTITAKDINESLKPQLAQMRQQILAAYVKAAENVFAERMADKQGTPSESVSDEELQSYMKANNLAKTETEKIRGFLESEKKRIGKQVLMMQLYKDLGVKNRLTALRYDVAVTSSMPQIGKDSASVTVQVFCDFGNPACNRSRLAMAQLKTELGERLRWVYRHFPVASSSIGMQASLVAICTHKQNKFWPVHDRFYDQQAKLTNENLVAEAVTAGAEETALKSCLQSAGTQAELDAEIKSAEMLGISTSPVYFVNGVRAVDVDQLFVEARKAGSKDSVAKQTE